MKVFLALFVLVLLFGAAPTRLLQGDELGDASASAADVRVMSFNIRYGAARDGENHWDNRKAFLVETIRAFDPDLLGTQETLGFQRDYLAEHLPEYAHLGVGREDGGDTGEMMALFYKKERFEKLAGGHFWLSETPEQVGSKSWDSSLPRMATWVKLRDRRVPAAPPLLFLNTHFDHLGASARLESARLIRRQVALLGENCSRIVTGDFNTAEKSEPYQALFAIRGNEPSPLVDTYRVAHPESGKAEGTFSGFKPNAIDGPRIDWIAVSPDWQVLAAEIDRTARNGRTPSDHFPVTAVLRRSDPQARGEPIGPREAARPGSKPNFLVILTDDQGYGDVSCYGETDVRTPNIDRLAAGGMLFTRMRSNCTVCSPSRAAILTGRYPDRAGVPGVIRTHPENSWGYLAPDVPTLAEELRACGYHTGIIGKWHLGLQSPNTPTERGFDFFHGFLGDMMDSYLDHLRHGNNYMRLNQEVIDPEGHATDLFTDWACEYLRERTKHADRPFFLYLAYNAPHFPIEPPADWLARVKARAPDMDENRAKNVAFVEHLDSGVGRVLDVLKETGLEENTLVVFSSDNGGSLPHAQSNGPWRDGKQSHYDGGLRIPFALRWPGKVAAGSRSDYAGQTFDVFPTFLELAGAKPSAELDAVSLLPLLNGEELAGQRDLYFVRREGGPRYGGKSYQAIVRGDWKLLQNDP